MAAFSIRPIEASDADSFIDCYAEISGDGIWIGGELPLSDAKIASLRRSAIEQPANLHTLVVVDDATGDEGSVVVGWLSVVVSSFMRADLGMGLRSRARQQGYGRKLLDAGIEWARAQGAHKIDLEVWPHNEPAIRLYESAGFVREGYRRRHWRRESGELWDAVEMSLILDDTSPGSPYGPYDGT